MLLVVGMSRAANRLMMASGLSFPGVQSVEMQCFVGCAGRSAGLEKTAMTGFGFYLVLL